MKDLNDYTAEVHRRYEVKCQTQRQRRTRMLALCLPLILCIVAGALALPPLLSQMQRDGALAESNLTQDVGSTMTQCVEQAESIAPSVDELYPEQMDAVAGVDEVAGEDAVEGFGPPEDFSFAFVWNCYGISSYDSATGKLVKTSHATHPEDFCTTLELTAEQRALVWDWLSELELESYPAQYDPYNPPDAETKLASEPNRDLILTLRADEQEITVACRGICLDGAGNGYDRRARAFLQVCDKLTDLLTGTPAWEALPEYEFFYE